MHIVAFSMTKVNEYYLISDIKLWGINLMNYDLNTSNNYRNLRQYFDTW